MAKSFPRIYFDNNATTPLDPKVLEILYKELSLEPENPSSVHYYGQKARQKLIEARDIIKSKFRLRDYEVIFTSSGTEGINLLLQGYADKTQKRHIISSCVEHSAVEKTLQHLEKKEFSVTRLPVGEKGAVDLQKLEQAITKDTAYIALIGANNETGVKTDIQAIANIARENEIPYFVDGVALLGKSQFDIYPGVSGIAFSGHKIHAPKGIGFVLVKKNLISPQIFGGGQEYGIRGGTENLSAIIALAKAIEIFHTETELILHRVQEIRDHFEKLILSSIENVEINGIGERVVNTSNLYFAGVDAETLLFQLDQRGIAASHGSACSSGALQPSKVLLNMGYPLERVRSSLRFSFSRYNTLQEVERSVEIITAAVQFLRQFSYR